MQNIVYIHGLNATSLSFNFIQRSLPKHNPIFIEYNSHQHLQTSVTDVLAQIPRNTPVSLVGHSLGGVIAVIIAAANPEVVQNLVTISSPLNGSKSAALTRWLPGSPEVIHDIMPNSDLIYGLHSLKLEIPTLSLISVKGHLSVISELNDSVVTVASQKALQFGRKVEVQANHFEIVLHDDAVAEIQKQIFGK